MTSVALRRSRGPVGLGGHEDSPPPVLGSAEEQHLVAGVTGAGLEQAGPSPSHVCGLPTRPAPAPQVLCFVFLRDLNIWDLGRKCALVACGACSPGRCVRQGRFGHCTGFRICPCWLREDEGADWAVAGGALLQRVVADVFSASSSPRHPCIEALERGVRCLLRKQLPNGDWPQVCQGGLRSPRLNTSFDLHDRFRTPVLPPDPWWRAREQGLSFGDLRFINTTSESMCWRQVCFCR